MGQRGHPRLGDLPVHSANVMACHGVLPSGREPLPVTPQYHYPPRVPSGPPRPQHNIIRLTISTFPCKRPLVLLAVNRHAIWRCKAVSHWSVATPPLQTQFGCRGTQTFDGNLDGQKIIGKCGMIDMSASHYL